MNRLAPLISRAATLRPLPARHVLALPAAIEIEGEWRGDLQFFVTAWLGAFLFIATLIG